jgi:hypothetical protein
MSHPRNRTFACIVRDAAPEAARRLFSKARIASHVAKAARDRRSREIAYEVKDRILEAALRVDPRLFRRFPDRSAGRWVWRVSGGEATHGRLLAP